MFIIIKEKSLLFIYLLVSVSEDHTFNNFW